MKQHVWCTYQGNAEHIPYGAETHRIVAARAIRSDGLQRGNYILAVGRLVRHKGFHTLIEAYKMVKTNKKLVIVGDSAFTDDYVQELHDRAYGNSNIFFLGQKTGRALDALYSNAYLIVHPSEAEGMSHVLLEALGHGKTVLASDIPEQREALEHLGFFFRNKSSTDCAAKLKFLLTHPELVGKKRNEAHALVTTKYNWDMIVRKTVATYTDAVRMCRKNADVHEGALANS
ncbi:MAG: glycosyltransferase family 4 protein [Candidatus Yonathbacteria bacterium]|nr:glycosyltransferase family 4 protein [Candidatus Yonathbacteria bacterium]